MTPAFSTAPLSETGLGMRAPARVALFSGNYNYTLDGANRTLNRLVGHLQAEAGARVRIYSPTSPRPAFPPTGELVSAPSVPIPMRPDYRLSLGLPRSLRRDVEAFAPDIVHLSAPDPLGAAALRLARRLGIPVVASVHTHFDGYLDYYALGWLKSVVRKRLRSFYNDCDFILAPTRAMAEQLQAQAPTAQVRVWGRGVDAAMFNPGRRSEAWRRAHGFAPDTAVVMFMGRIVVEKGLATFVEALRQVEAARGPQSVVVVGDGPALRWFRDRLPRAVFTGFLSGEALATAVASSDIFLNPSSTETFGNVNLEAMASGVPLICADAPNTRTLVQDGVSGLLCRPQDPRSHCEALLALIDDPARRVGMGREAHRRSGAFRWPQILDQIVEVYREALTAPLGRRAALEVVQEANQDGEHTRPAPQTRPRKRGAPAEV